MGKKTRAWARVFLAAQHAAKQRIVATKTLEQNAKKKEREGNKNYIKMQNK